MTAKRLLLLTVAFAFAAAVGCSRQNNCCYKEPVPTYYGPPPVCDTCK